MSKTIRKIRVRVGPDHANDKASTDRAYVVAERAPGTQFYQDVPTFKEAVDGYGAAGVELRDAHDEVVMAEAVLATARAKLQVKRTACHAAQTVCAAQVEQHAVQPLDAIDCGFDVLVPVRRGLVLPVDIALKHDRALDLVRVHVKYAGGKHKVALEMSPEPVGPATWVRLDGNAMRRTLHGLAPGLWWFRAATAGATQQSDWFGPVAVLVR